MAKEKYRSRVHMLLLYPENAEHSKALEKIKQSYDYAMCLHNRDADENGVLKKEHYHVVIRCQNATWSSAICKELGIQHNYIEDVKKFENALQYLIHYNDTDKAQYTIEEVHGNLKTKLIESINKVEKSEGDKVIEIIDFIDNQDNLIKRRDFAKWCAMNGYWSEYRRAGAIINGIIDEKNQELISAKIIEERTK